MQQLPQGFLEHLQRISSMDAERYRQSLDAPRVRALRLADCKMDRAAAQLYAPCGDAVLWEDGAFVAHEDFNGNCTAHRTGMFYVQEPSAMLPVAALDWKSDWRVLDLCASPGGKTHQLACRLQSGALVSNEIVPSRARTLLSNVERMGISRDMVTNAAPQALADAFGASFDAVLVDAPCSGEGLFRRDADAMREWSPQRSLGCAQRQLEILTQADRMLKQGGYLVYSTCTFSVAENEGVVDAFLRTHDYALCDALPAVREHTASGETLGGMSYEKARRYYPYFGCGEGQFLCVLQKGDAKTDARQKMSGTLGAPSREALGLCRAFLSECGVDCGASMQGELLLERDTIVLCPLALRDLSGRVKTLRTGTAIGSTQKGRFEPHHHFFSAFGAQFAQKLFFAGDDPRAQAYLRGEELDASELCDGYAAVMIDGCAAGGVRVRKHRAKNLYPKGLRT